MRRLRPSLTRLKRSLQSNSELVKPKSRISSALVLILLSAQFCVSNVAPTSDQSNYLSARGRATDKNGNASQKQECSRKIPQPLDTLKPDFSGLSKNRKLRGVVGIALRIGTDGNVRKAWVIKSLEKDVDQRVLESTKSSKWLPAMKDCKPVESDVHLEVSVNLG
jgi:outer membrane biosynthesis protein TonB